MGLAPSFPVFQEWRDPVTLSRVKVGAPGATPTGGFLARVPVFAGGRRQQVVVPVPEDYLEPGYVRSKTDRRVAAELVRRARERVKAKAKEREESKRRRAELKELRSSTYRSPAAAARLFITNNRKWFESSDGVDLTDTGGDWLSRIELISGKSRKPATKLAIGKAAEEAWRKGRSLEAIQKSLEVLFREPKATSGKRRWSDVDWNRADELFRLIGDETQRWPAWRPGETDLEADPSQIDPEDLQAWTRLRLAGELEQLRARLASAVRESRCLTGDERRAAERRLVEIGRWVRDPWMIPESLCDQWREVGIGGVTCERYGPLEAEIRAVENCVTRAPEIMRQVYTVAPPGRYDAPLPIADFELTAPSADSQQRLDFEDHRAAQVLATAASSTREEAPVLNPGSYGHHQSMYMIRAWDPRDRRRRVFARVLGDGSDDAVKHAREHDPLLATVPADDIEAEWLDNAERPPPEDAFGWSWHDSRRIGVLNRGALEFWVELVDREEWEGGGPWPFPQDEQWRLEVSTPNGKRMSWWPTLATVEAEVARIEKTPTLAATAGAPSGGYTDRFITFGGKRRRVPNVEGSTVATLDANDLADLNPTPATGTHYRISAKDPWERRQWYAAVWADSPQEAITEAARFDSFFREMRRRDYNAINVVELDAQGEPARMASRAKTAPAKKWLPFYQGRKIDSYGADQYRVFRSGDGWGVMRVRDDDTRERLSDYETPFATASEAKRAAEQHAVTGVLPAPKKGAAKKKAAKKKAAKKKAATKKAAKKKAAKKPAKAAKKKRPTKKKAPPRVTTDQAPTMPGAPRPRARRARPARRSTSSASEEPGPVDLVGEAVRVPGSRRGLGTFPAKRREVAGVVFTRASANSERAHAGTTLDGGAWRPRWIYDLRAEPGGVAVYRRGWEDSAETLIGKHRSPEAARQLAADDVHQLDIVRRRGPDEVLTLALDDLSPPRATRVVFGDHRTGVAADELLLLDVDDAHAFVGALKNGALRLGRGPEYDRLVTRDVGDAAVDLEDWIDLYDAATVASKDERLRRLRHARLIEGLPPYKIHAAARTQQERLRERLESFFDPRWRPAAELLGVIGGR